MLIFEFLISITKPNFIMMNSIYTNIKTVRLSFFVVFSFCCMVNIGFAQTLDGIDPLQQPQYRKAAASEELTPFTALLKPTTQGVTNRPEAMWDVQFKFAHNDSLPASFTPRVYGFTWTGTEFWGTPWNSATAGAYMDTIVRYDAKGKFLGVLNMKNSTAMRTLTVLNGAVWGANTQDSIYKISLTTGEVIKKVKTQTTGGIRFMTADPTGKLWVGNFSTALSQIDTNGVLLQSIPATNHRLGGMSGAAYDAISPGGPYLWVLCQTGLQPGAAAGTYVRMVKINPNSGITTVERDVKLDAADVGASIAGTLTIAQMPGLTKPSLITLSQNGGAPATGRVVAYELNNFAPPQTVDLGLDSLGIGNGYTIIPRIYSSSINFGTKITNRSFVNAPADSKLTYDISRGATIVNTKNTPISINAFSQKEFTVGGLPALATGDYNAFFFTSASSDALAVNDSLRQFFSVSDSTMGRDLYDFGATSLRVSAGGATPSAPRRIGTYYSFPSRATINSVTMHYRATNVNDTFHIAIFRMKDGRPTADSLGGSEPYITVSEDTQAVISAGVRRTFKLKQPLTLNPTDTVLICLTDDGRGFNFVASTVGNNFGITWSYRQSYLSGTVTIPTGWYADTSTVASVLRRALVIRPNLNIRVGTNDPKGNIADLVLMPNPTNGNVHLSLALDNADKVRLEVLDIAGKSVYTEGGLFTNNGAATHQTLDKDLSLNHLPNGLYLLKVSTQSGGVMVKRFVKQ